MELLTALVGALAVLIGTYTLAMPVGSRRIQERLERLDRTEMPSVLLETRLHASFAHRIGASLLTFLRRRGARLLPSTVLTDLSHRLQIAGEPLSLHAYIALQFSALALALVLLAAGLALGLRGIPILGVLLGGSAVAAAPFLWLYSAGSSRQARMLRALPDTVDLVVTMVEAGLSIDAALWKAANHTDGPLSEELKFAMRETTLGRSRREALLALLERTAVLELRAFIHAVVHALETGVSLSDVLRTQAREIRLKKRQRAEAKAGTAPVKMLVIMLFFVMPSLFLIVLGPAVMRAVEIL